MKIVIRNAAAALLLSGCTTAGDLLTPHSDRRAYCSFADAKPVQQIGLYALDTRQEEGNLQ